MVPPASASTNRPIRSYVVRSGRLTDSQRRAIEQHWQDHVIECREQELDPTALFGNANPLTVEIGFGMGDSLLTMAEQEPGCNFLGIDVHRPGIGRVLNEIETRKLRNLKLVCHDATEVFSRCLAANSVDRVLILFPDPWPKKRHHKRRLLQPDFAGLLRDRLKPGGRLHLATDWLPYAEHMLEVLEDTEGLENTAGTGCFETSPQRPPTRFEQRGRKLGHSVKDLVFVKTNAPVTASQVPSDG